MGTSFGPISRQEHGEFWPGKDAKVGVSITGELLGETPLKEGRRAIGLLVAEATEPTLIGVNPSLGDALDALAPPLHSIVKVTWSGEKQVGKPQPMRLYSVELVAKSALPF